MKKHIPNTITCCNLVSGCIAIVFALNGNAQFALVWIIIGAVFDFFDGMSARLLGVSSPIGKELDSLADDVTFGVAPSSIVFNFLCGYHYHELPSLLAVSVPFLAYVMAAFSALRLAKFNLDERQSTSFIGLPTPANALFWGALIVGIGDKLGTIPYGPWLVLAMVFVSSYLLIAEIPLFALKFKHWGWSGNEVKYIFLLTSAAMIICPLVMGWGVIGIAAVIAWYVILSLLTGKH